MPSPLAIEPIVQKAGMDCGVAALAMYLGLPYRTVSDEAMKQVPDFLNGGLTRTEVCKIGEGLGYDLERSRKFHLDTDHGVLFCQFRRSYHFVTLFRGSIVNPTDGLVWEPDAWFAKTHMQPVTLIHFPADELDNQSGL